MSPLTSITSLCLRLPTFELRLELVRTPELDTTAVALLAAGGPAGGEIRQVSERAAEAGVRPGMRVSQAISLCPSLTLLEPDPAHYREATREILEAIEGVSPIVQPGGESGLFHVGADGLGRLYGSPPRQVERALYALLEVLPAPVVAAFRVGWAPGLFGARVAAALSEPGRPVFVEASELASFLRPRPIAALPLPAEALDRLERLEITTLGAFADLPSSAVIRHFGIEALDAHARAKGERVDPVRPLHRPRPIRVSLDLPSPVGDRAALERGLDRLLERALGRPERKERSVRALRAGGRLEEGGSWEVEATLREPSAAREVLSFALRTRLSLSPPPRAVESLFVEFSEFGVPVLQSDLFARTEAGGRAAGGVSLPAGRISRTLQEAVRELTLKLGHSPLYRVVEVDPWSRIPERRHALVELET